MIGLGTLQCICLMKRLARLLRRTVLLPEPWFVLTASHGVEGNGFYAAHEISGPLPSPSLVPFTSNPPAFAQKAKFHLLAQADNQVTT